MTLAPGTRVVGVHATKASRLPYLLEHGLRRPPTGWFLLDAASGRETVEATLSAAFHLAMRFDGELGRVREAGAYTRWFERNRESLPALLVFADEVTGEETLDRYLWLGPPRPALTAPYTKVERAGRVVEPAGVTVVQLALGDAARCEEEVEARPGTVDWWLVSRLVRRVTQDGEPGGDPQPVDTKLGRFCAALAAAAYGPVEAAL